MSNDTPNPIVKFVYSSNKNAYETTLADGKPGPDVSLSDIFTIKELSQIEVDLSVQLSRATEIKNDINKHAMSMSSIKNEFSEYYPAIESLVASIKKTLTE